MKLLWHPLGSILISGVLSWLGRTFKTKKFERIAAFAGIGSHASQEEIFDILQGYYPSNAEFIVLPMDFSFMGAGHSRQPYLDQLAELRHLKRDPIIGDRIHPFVAVDPRRDGFLRLAKDYVERHNFAGIKLYPPLGFSPQDKRLDPLWEWAETDQIPIMSHCSRGGVYFRGHPADISWPTDVLIGTHTAGSNQTWTDHLSDPSSFRPILRRYPTLKICLAHMGGNDECETWLSEPWPNHLSQSNWLTVILGLMKEFPNVYTDVSYVGYQSSLHPLIHVIVRDPVLGSRILFGSDFYMVQQDATEREFGIRLRSLLSEDEFLRISWVNPQNYLKRG